METYTTEIEFETCLHDDSSIELLARVVATYNIIENGFGIEYDLENISIYYRELDFTLEIRELMRLTYEDIVKEANSELEAKLGII